MDTPDDPTVPPDTKDWTWVLDRACPECGFDAGSVRALEVKNRLEANASAWVRVVGQQGGRERPTAGVWSVLEYACHVRDVHRVFGGRVALMLAEDDPLFDDWDQDRAAVEGRYGEQDPDVVAVELLAAATDGAGRYAAVTGDQWQRPGRRSNGSVFTVLSLARYHLHDVEHHLHDVSG